ncbi:AraC family transcriptional regulator [Lachnobacterium bovis]|uniref:AraC family transcriptional regulator n=1 Tax=Lachnobacterium bovis TaxID=140626 RepID=UPI000490E9AA|nr:AraC family transcriptional regulator [Lachnobacterium bovis]
MNNLKKEQFYKEFIQREEHFFRAPFNPEIEFYNTIKSGDIKKIKELCSDAFINKKGLGTLSSNPLTNMKYHFVITTALTARYCIQGGMDLSTAYGLSDFYIQKMDSCHSIKEISDLHPIMCLDYTKRMQNLRKKNVCSIQVAQSIDYIYENLHSRITVAEIAEHVGLNRSYLSRLFKKEINCSINEYIRNKKIETAKNMLIYSSYKPSEISSLLAFSSQSYFTEIFKKQVGCTPTEFTKHHII